MMIDFALEAEREEGKPAARGDPSGLPAALPADHDDHHGGAARRPAADARPGHRIGAAPSARRRPSSAACIVSQMLTLFTTPVIYLAFDRLAVRLTGRAPAKTAGDEAVVVNLSALFIAPSRRHHAADHRHHSGRPVRLCTAAGLAAAAGRFPHHLGECVAAGRQPRHGRHQRCQPARTASRPDRRRDRDDLHQLGRPVPHHPAVRSRPRHQRRGARRAGGDQRRARRPADQPAQQPHLPQGQPGGRAGADPGADLENHDAAARSTTPRPTCWSSACRRSAASAR